jgi:hypothetical protein
VLMKKAVIFGSHWRRGCGPVVDAPTMHPARRSRCDDHHTETRS